MSRCIVYVSGITMLSDRNFFILIKQIWTKGVQLPNVNLYADAQVNIFKKLIKNMRLSCLINVHPPPIFSNRSKGSFASENCNLYQGMALVFLWKVILSFNLIEKDKKHYCKKKSDVHLENKSGNQIINNT